MKIVGILKKKTQNSKSKRNFIKQDRTKYLPELFWILLLLSTTNKKV